MTPDEVLVLTEVRTKCRSGAALRTRVDADISQTEMASALGVSVPTISRWEHGERIPRGGPAIAYGRLLRRLAEAVRGEVG